MAGNAPFTSRNLCFVSKDFHHFYENNKNINIESWFQSIFENYYWRSFIGYSQEEKEKFMENTLNIIEAVPNQQYKVDKELEFAEEFKEIVEYLIGIQKYAITNIEYREFDYKDFLDKCLKVPINREKLQYIYNNLDDTLLLIDNNNNMDERLKNKFYQINFIKNNYENILNNFDKVSGFEVKLELDNNNLLQNNDIKKYLLRLRFLKEIIKRNENKVIYESNLNYNLFTPYSNELSRILYDLIKYKTKNYFQDLIKFLFEYPDSFKIIHYFYPYNNEELKKGELKFGNYYIYVWFNLFIRKYNFSVRLEDQRYDITFPKENQNDKITPYFILNEKNSLNLSKNSFLKLNKIKDNKYEYIFKYLDDISENNTKDMIKLTIENINSLYKESPLKNFEEIDDLQLESFNFFTSNSCTLIGRVSSLLLNLADKYSDIIKYLKKSFCFLELDAIKILEFLFDNLDINHLDNLIQNMTTISFFCESELESMLWKYRILINNLESQEKEINNNIIYNYFKSRNINVNDDLSKIEKEINMINKLNIYWKENKIYFYKSKLLTLQNLLISYKNKDIKNAEIIKLRNDADRLLNFLDT